MARIYTAYVADRRIEADTETRLDALVREAHASLEREVIDLRRTRDLLLSDMKNAHVERDTARTRVAELEAEIAKLRVREGTPR